MTTNQQVLFGRKINLIAYGQPGANSSGNQLRGSLGLDLGGAAQQPTTSDGIDLSEMHIQFAVRGADSQTPKTLVATIFNLSDATATKIKNEFSKVVLQAGYVNGPYGVIFNGTIKQVKRGRLNATDTYVTIYAADGDLLLNFATVSAAVAPGASHRDVAAQLDQAARPAGASLDPDQFSPTGGIYPRGKVLFGMWRDNARALAKNTGTSFFVESGVVKFVPLTGYLPGEAVVLNSRTGLIDVPESTEGGIFIKCLLNPKIAIGTRLQINNADINTTTVREQGFPSYIGLSFFASTSADGIYRALAAEHLGDTRGEAWQTNITALSVDPSAPVDQSVQAAG